MDDNKNLLDDYLVTENTAPEYYTPDRGKRFANYFIDRIILVALFFGVGVLYAMMPSSSNNDFYYDGYSDTSVMEELMLQVVSIFISIFYYACTEYFMNGKSIGKLVTKTRVIRRSGGELTFLRCIGRSAARLIPFEAFSIFFNDNNIMWHDSLSDTMVVEDF